MNKILITGGAGFIGSHLSERLISLGMEVCAIDNFDDFYPEAIKRSNIKNLLGRDEFKFLEGDIRDRDLLKDVIRKSSPDIIVHLAAKAGVRPSILDPILYQDVNILGTNILLEVMREEGLKKFVFASSSSVYGNCPNFPFSEDDPMANPISPYGMTKKAGEVLCYTYHHLYGIDTVCLRFFTVYGPRQRPDMAIHKFTKKIVSGEKIEVFAEGKSGRDYTYIDDIVSGIHGSMDYVSRLKKPVFEIVNLGGSKIVRLNELVRIVEKGLDKKADLKLMPSQPGDVELTSAEISKAEKLFGYKPETSIEEGIDNFIKWYRGHR